MRHSLRHIRQSSPQTKFKWLVGLSTTATIIVVIVWVLYMRAFVFIGSDQNTQEDVRVGLWPVFKNGLIITGSSINKAFGNMFSSDLPSYGRNTTTIQNPN